MYRLLKPVVEGVAANLPNRHRRGGSLVLAYHNVVPGELTGLGDSSLHLSEQAFDSQLTTSCAEADVVDLPTLIGLHGRPGRRIAFTFDDAYSGAIQHALPLCAKRGVVPTVFVAPRLYGTFTPWDVLASQGRWTVDDRSRFLEEQRGLPSGGPPLHAQPLPEMYRITREADLRRTVSEANCHIGHHSFNHANLSRLTADEVSRELAETVASLSTFGDRFIEFIAYPYGRAPDLAMRPVLQSAVSAGFMVEGGWVPAGVRPDPFAFPRLNVPAGISMCGFRAHLRAWLVK